MTPSLPADVFGVRSSRIRSPYSFLPLGPWNRNECVTNEPQRTSARRLYDTSILSNFSLLQPNLASLWGQKHQQAGESPLLDSLPRTILHPHTLFKWIGLHSTLESREFRKCYFPQTVVYREERRRGLIVLLFMSQRIIRTPFLFPGRRGVRLKSRSSPYS